MSLESTWHRARPQSPYFQLPHALISVSSLIQTGPGLSKLCSKCKKTQLRERGEVVQLEGPGRVSAAPAVSEALVSERRPRVPISRSGHHSFCHSVTGCLPGSAPNAGDAEARSEVGGNGPRNHTAEQKPCVSLTIL